MPKTKDQRDHERIARALLAGLPLSKRDRTWLLDRSYRLFVADRILIEFGYKVETAGYTTPIEGTTDGQSIVT